MAHYTEEQKRAIDPRHSVWVSASAGSGKTKILAGRVVALLLKGTPPERILCLTFTKAAASEMHNRLVAIAADMATMTEHDLRIMIEQHIQDNHIDDVLMARARHLFTRLIETPVRIHNIHSFCEYLLRRFPLEAGISPVFMMWDDATARRYQQQVIENNVTPDLVACFSRQSYEKAMQTLFFDRNRIESFFATKTNNVAHDIAKAIGLTEILDPARAWQQFLAYNDAVAPQWRGLLPDLLQQSKEVEKVEILSSWFAATGVDQEKYWPAFKLVFLTKEERPRKKVFTKMAACQESAQEMTAKILAYQQQCQAYQLWQQTQLLWEAGQKALTDYRILKERAHALDFDDLLIHAHHLLASSAMAPWVLYKLDGGLDHVLLDEAQDTSPLQWSILRAILREFTSGLGARDTHRTIFVVGDEKQSIYSFQHADPETFHNTKAMLRAQLAAINEPLYEAKLQKSFRSAPAILKCVDAVFEEEGIRQGVSDQPVHHMASRQQDKAVVEFWPLIEDEKPEEELAARIGDQISAWLRDGTCLPGRNRPIAPADIIILVRNRKPLAGPIIRALKMRGVPVAGLDRLSLPTALSVQDMMALARFVLLPEDDLNLAVLLKGPFIGFTDDNLLALLPDRKDSLYAALMEQAGQGTPSQKALEYLDHVQDLAKEAPPDIFFGQLLIEACPVASSGWQAMMTRLGHDCLDPLEEFLNLAASYTTSSLSDLQHFVDFMDRHNIEIKREKQGGSLQGQGVVEIMTVHGAKGLEAPIVFLADTTSAPTRGKLPPWLWVADMPLYVNNQAMAMGDLAMARDKLFSKEQEEYRRLLYVAMTRAKDCLYVAGFKRERMGEASWYHHMAPAFARLDQPQLRETYRPEAQYLYADDGAFPFHHQKISEPETYGPSPAWLTEFPRVETIKPRLSPSDEKRMEDDIIFSSSRSLPPEAARARGVFIHRLLELIPAMPPPMWPETIKTMRDRSHDAAEIDPDQTLVGEMLRLLQDKACQPIFFPGDDATVYREQPLAADFGTHRLLGQVDLLLIRPDFIWCIDFKTGHFPFQDGEQIPSSYKAQMESYYSVLKRIYPASSIRLSLLWTAATRLVDVPIPSQEKTETAA
jgi:ATP-dependent helicase/nuclease subunit A